MKAFALSMVALAGLVSGIAFGEPGDVKAGVLVDSAWHKSDISLVEVANVKESLVTFNVGGSIDSGTLAAAVGSNIASISSYFEGAIALNVEVGVYAGARVDETLKAEEERYIYGFWFAPIKIKFGAGEPQAESPVPPGK